MGAVTIMGKCYRQGGCSVNISAAFPFIPFFLTLHWAVEKHSFENMTDVGVARLCREGAITYGFVAVTDWWEHVPWSPEDMVVGLSHSQSLGESGGALPHASLLAIGSSLCNA